ncbi:MauE/DoxX family redox-associated membrane protein [Nonomuraea sp. ATR24]|uniref:MauE/DoxX family redox-associated membrane protein n=1 Tax=unclassified Nonomuraea TaxID=2593643 RepID=UPI0033E83FF6
MLYVSLACRLTLVAVLALAAVAKLRSPRVFAASLAGFDVVPARLRGPLAVLVPAAELLVALLLALPPTVTAGFVAATALCLGLTAVPVLVVARGKRVTCACFGASEAPLGVRHIARNAVLLAAAVTGAAVALTAGGGMPPTVPGIVLAVVSAGVLTVLIVFVDDLASLFASPSSAGGR